MYAWVHLIGGFLSYWALWWIRERTVHYKVNSSLFRGVVVGLWFGYYSGKSGWCLPRQSSMLAGAETDVKPWWKSHIYGYFIITKGTSSMGFQVSSVDHVFVVPTFGGLALEGTMLYRSPTSQPVYTCRLPHDNTESNINIRVHYKIESLSHQYTRQPFY